MKSKPIRAPELLAVIDRWRRRVLVTTNGLAPPWTTRMVAKLDEVGAALESEVAFKWPSAARVLRTVGWELAAADILIPETIAGAAAFKCLASATCLDSDRLIQARQIVIEAVFDRERLDLDVAEIAARFEVGGPAAGRLRLGGIAEEMRMNSINAGRRVTAQTKLKSTMWRFGARLRCGLREVARGSESIKAAGLTAGWTCPEDFSRDFRRAMGVPPERFRALLNDPD